RAALLLANAFMDLGMPLVLRRLPEDSSLINALQHACKGRGLLLKRPDQGWPWIPLDCRWTEPERLLNAGRRSDFRRAQRIAYEMGPVSVEMLAPDARNCEPLLEEAFAVEAASWKGESRSAILCDPLRAAFYRD